MNGASAALDFADVPTSAPMNGDQINRKAVMKMTDRQNKIFEAIKDGYKFVEDVALNDEIYDIEVIYETFKEGAENDELKTIKQIAIYFFLIVKIFGTCGG